MKVVELNEGRKIEYELNGTKLDFADGTLTVNLAKYQRDSDITKTVIGDKDGNLLLIDKPDALPEKNADGRFYVAIVEIPATEYEEVEVEARPKTWSWPPQKWRTRTTAPRTPHPRLTLSARQSRWTPTR